MENVDFDEEEKARRKRDQIEWRNKKRASTTFMLIMSLVEIIITILIMLVVFLGFAAILFKFFDANLKPVQLAFEIGSIVIFFGSMILGFFLYKVIAKWAIKQFKLEDKLSDDVMLHYKKMTKEEREAEMLE